MEEEGRWGGEKMEDLHLLLSCTNCSLLYVAFSPCDAYLWPFIRMSPSLGSAKPFLLGPRRVRLLFLIARLELFESAHMLLYFVHEALLD